MKILFFWLNLSILGLFLFLNSCGIYRPVDAKEFPPEPDKRVQKNIEEGRGFSFGKTFGNKTGEFDFASSNELWRASLDTLEFMPLALANYSGGIIVTDWYSEGADNNESIKISIRFLSNEIRSDALKIKVFYKNCSMQNNCEVTDRSSQLSDDLSKKILTQAAIYEKEDKSKKKKKKYINSALKD